MPVNKLQGDDVAVTWDEARTTNQEIWDQRAIGHEAGYDAVAFAADPSRSQVRGDLTVLEPFLPNDSVAGLDLLHLQCHIGLDTISFARHGARVTGLDFSAESLTVAERTARAAGVDAAWVQADALAARSAIHGDFDVVFTGVGSITWLNDLDQWARQIEALLRPGGVFYIRDGHPMLYALDEAAEPLVVRNRYFANGTAQAWDDNGSYIEGVTTTAERTYEWPHAMSEIIGALLRAGLTLRLFEEHKVIDWKWSQIMEVTSEGFVFPETYRDKVPLMFTLIATKPMA